MTKANGQIDGNTGGRERQESRRGQEERQATGQIGRGTNKRIGKDAWTDGQTDQTENMEREVERPIVGGQREKQDEWGKKGKRARGDTPMVHHSGTGA